MLALFGFFAGVAYNMPPMYFIIGFVCLLLEPSCNCKE